MHAVLRKHLFLINEPRGRTQAANAAGSPSPGPARRGHGARAWRGVLACAWVPLAMMVAALASPVQAAEPVCGDFLARAGHKPAHLQFTGCEPGHSAQIRVLRATYRVAGRFAAGVETALIQTTGMPPLRFICCGWESPPDGQGVRYGRFPGSHGFDHEVHMHSEETLVDQRADWPAIGSFHVQVELPLESP